MPNLHFTREEFAARQARARERMSALGFDGLLMFKVEDMYWLCGLDTDGFVIFHAMFLGGEGQLTHVSRPADLANIRYSSICEDVRVWIDAADNPKTKAIRELLASHGMQGKRIGLQIDTMGLTPGLYKELHEALDGFCTLVDAPDFIRELRLVKSPQELEYHRRAGAIMDKVQDAAIEATFAGAFEGDIYAKIYETIFKNDGDLPASIPPLGSGESAMNVRYSTGRRTVQPNDQVTHELGCAFRHYHAAHMLTVLTGPTIDDRHRRMHAACVDALDGVQEKLSPGNTLGEVFEAHRAAFAKHGFEHAILAACGYTMGATFPPSWMEQPMIYVGNPFVLQENMTFFTHMILTDQRTGLTMSLGEQSIITAGGPERITHVPREPIIRR